MASWTAKLIPLADIPSISQLYKSSYLISTSATLRDPSKTLNNTICLIRADITTLEVSAIVNAANRKLLGGGGVDGAIHLAAGSELLKECRTLSGCNTGEAKITRAYNLPCNRVIHTVGPIYSSENQRQPGRARMLLQSCYRKCLELAVRNKCKSLAFSALSTGIYGYPSEEAAAVACDEVRRFLEEDSGDGDFEKVIFCCFTQKDEDAYKTMIPKYFPPTEEDIPKESEDAEDTEKKEVADKAEGDGKVKEADPGAVKEKGTKAEAEPEVMDDKPPVYEEKDSRTA